MVAVIFHNQYFKISVGTFLINRRKTQFQILYMIFIWYDNGDQGLSLYLHLASVPAWPLCHLHFCLDPHSFVMCFQCSFPCFIGISLACRICCCRLHMTPPMIQYPWNVHYVFRLFAAPQDQVIILCSIII